MTLRQLLLYRQITIMGGCEPGVMCVTRAEAMALFRECLKVGATNITDRILGWDVRVIE
jgi:hypothetical protein